MTLCPLTVRKSNLIYEERILLISLTWAGTGTFIIGRNTTSCKWPIMSQMIEVYSTEMEIARRDPHIRSKVIIAVGIWSSTSFKKYL